jgi:hypothetical protein
LRTLYTQDILDVKMAFERVNKKPDLKMSTTDLEAPKVSIFGNMEIVHEQHKC